MNDKQINNIVSSGIVDTKGLDILDTRPSVGSISEPDEFTSVEMERYLLYSQNIKESPIAGCEAFPGEMLGPSSEKVISRRAGSGSAMHNHLWPNGRRSTYIPPAGDRTPYIPWPQWPRWSHYFPTSFFFSIFSYI